MESIRPKAIRSKSALLANGNQARSSVRRKVSFNKVRNRFEDLTRRRSDETIGQSDSKSASSDRLSSKSSDKSVPSVSEIRANSGDRQTLDKQCNRAITQTAITNPSLVKRKIKYFEEKTCNKIYCDENGLMVKETDCCDKSEHSLGNNDKQESFDGTDTPLDVPPVHSDQSNDLPVEDVLDSPIGDTLCKTETNRPVLVRTSSTASDTSVTSDILSFDDKSDIVFRRPRNVEQTSVKPIPRQRISLKKIYEIDIIGQQSFTEIDAMKQDTMLFDPKRGSGISQDSGISDLSQNQTSYLWQTNRYNNNNTDRLAPQINIVPHLTCEAEDLYQDQNPIYEDEHIYEELRDCLTLSPGEWIDIENEDKDVLKAETVISRRSQVLKHSNNYRKSFRPIACKRKTMRKEAAVRQTLCPSDVSDSATEYEDIDDDDGFDTTSISTTTTESTITSGTFSSHEFDQNFLFVSNRNSSSFEQRVSHHIYEAIPTIDENQEFDIKTKLVRELSNKLSLKATVGQRVDNTIDIKSDSRVQSQPNIYTETPIRTRLVSNIKSDEKRNSIMSRNSSIYISPNYGYDYQKYMDSHGRGTSSPRQFSHQHSITASIASYLELNIGADNMNSPFKSEPLYQFYQKDVRRRAELWIHNHIETDSDYNDYENSIYGTRCGSDISDGQTSDRSVKKDDTIRNMLAKHNISAMDFVGTGPNRSLWCQLPQVINSKDNLLSTLSDKEKRLQESMFEIITSEASYCKSLNILVSHFHNCIEFNENNPQILSQREKKCLFSNVVDISAISLKLLTELEKRFEQNILLYDVCDILEDFCVNQFQQYIHYCAYQRDQAKLLTKLTQSRPAFVDLLQRLESNQICQNQNLLSFLMLPMQRITRYPLLIDAVCQQLPPDSPILESTRKALGAANQLVGKCNEETTKVQRMQELIEIEKILHFKGKMKSYPIVSGARYLVKRGSVLKLTPQISPKKTVGKTPIKWTKSSIHLFLFSDLLVLAKKKSDNNYSVFDYCSRNTVQLVSLTSNGDTDTLTGKVRQILPRNYHHLSQLTLLHNHESKSMEYTIAFNLESEKLRWIEAVSQPLSPNPNEVIYEEWDCPQVQCVRTYSAQQTDEINLEETDVLNVFRKMKDGWFEGQRIRDGMRGWFPSEYTEEIVNQHVRARNMKLRHRLLMYTKSIIEEQKK